MITTNNLTKEYKELRNYDDILCDMNTSEEYLDRVDYELIYDILSDNNNEVAYISELDSYVILGDLEKNIINNLYIAGEYDSIIEYISEEYLLELPKYYFS